MVWAARWPCAIVVRAGLLVTGERVWWPTRGWVSSS